MTFRIDIRDIDGKVLNSVTWETDYFQECLLDSWLELGPVSFGPAKPVVIRIRRIL